MSVQINDLDKSLEEQLHLNEKQEKTDNNLKTTDKTIVGAINELFQDVDSGKQLIANAIGDSSITKDSTFQAMSNAIASKVTPAGTAVAADVLSGKTFINSTGQTITGTMTERGYYTDYSGYLATSNDSVFIGVQPGAYLFSTGSGSPEIMVPKSRINNLSPENIVSGKEILGVWGSATASSLGGKRWASGQVAITTNEYKTFYLLDGSNAVSGIRYLNISNLNFTPSIILAYCKVSNSLVYTTIYLNGLFTSVAYAGGWSSSNGGYIFKNDTNVVNGNVFTLPTKINSITSYKFDWIAFE